MLGNEYSDTVTLGLGYGLVIPQQSICNTSGPSLRFVPILPQPIFCPLIPSKDQFITEEVVLVRQHLTTNRMIATKPAIGLFSDRGVEPPALPIIT